MGHELWSRARSRDPSEDSLHGDVELASFGVVGGDDEVGSVFGDELVGLLLGDA